MDCMKMIRARKYVQEFVEKYKIIYLDGLRNYDVGKMQLENAGEPSDSFDAVSKYYTDN